jgi:hypothetical protein
VHEPTVADALAVQDSLLVNKILADAKNVDSEQA